LLSFPFGELTFGIFSCRFCRQMDHEIHGWRRMQLTIVFTIVILGN